MSATAGGYGLIPVNHPSGQNRANAYTIATGYAANIFKGDPVKLVSTVTGTGVQLATSDGTRTGTVAGITVLGVFAGCEYIDANGKPTVSNFWPTGTTATNIVAYVYDDPATVFSVQADGSVAATYVGAETDLTGFSAPGGSTVTGLSSATVSATTKTNTNTGQFRITAFERSADNAAGDSYTKLLVNINIHMS
jgi:hypothetical protein